MIYIVSLVLLFFYGHMLGKYPEYTIVWGIINTFAYFAVIESGEIFTIEDVPANVIGWFAAPFMFWTML